MYWPMSQTLQILPACSCTQAPLKTTEGSLLRQLLQYAVEVAAPPPGTRPEVAGHVVGAWQVTGRLSYERRLSLSVLDSCCGTGDGR